MTTTDLQAQLEEIAQSLVMIDRDDGLAGVVAVRDRLGTLAGDLRAAGEEAVAVAADAAASVAGDCVEQDAFTESAAAALGRAIETLQECLEDARAGVPGPAADPPPGAQAATPRPAATDKAAGPEPAAEAEDAGAPVGLALSDFVDDAIAAEFIGRQGDAIGDVQNMVLSFDDNVSDASIDELKRWFHTLKGESGLLGLDTLAELCHVAEDMIQSESPAACVDRLLEVFDWMQSCFDFLAKKGPVPEELTDLLTRLRTPPVVVAADPVPESGPEPEPEPDPEPEQADAPPVAAEPATPAAAPAVELPEVVLPDYTSKNLLESDVGLLQDFIGEATEHLDASEAHLLAIEADPHESEALNAVFRGFHTIKGLAGFAELDAIQELAHKAENLLDMGRKGDLELTGVNMDLVFESVDLMKKLVENVTEALATTGHQTEVPHLANLVARLMLATSGEPVPAATAPQPGAASEPAPKPEPEPAPEPASAPPAGKSGFVPLANMKKSAPAAAAAAPPAGKSGFVPLANMKKSAPTTTTTTTPEAPTPAAAKPAPPAPAPAPERPAEAPAAAAPPAVASAAVKVKEAVRVDADRLDRLVETIGELVIAESMVSQNAEVRERISVKLAKDLDHLDKISRELQEIGMSLRMVPVRPVFQKMARLVRDLAKKTNRKVEFVMNGEDTELDKNVVDKIGDPLVHMVRNAVDHGLEPTAEDRQAAGKPASGKIELRAFHKGGNICIEVADDGRGLPRDKILQKAIDRGLVKEGDQLSDRDIHNLIFEPGFSTASQVTDISGRGVGMDVVRRNIEELRGTCDISSEPGKGSVFSIKLPLTLAIIEGMVVSCGQEHYIVPTLSVVRLVRPSRDDLFRVFDRGEMMAHEAEHIPLFRLGQLFNIDVAKTDPEDAVVVVVEEEGRKLGILADELLGQQSIVIKSLGESMQNTDGVAGGAIMSNGNVALILDVAGLIRVAHDTVASTDEAAHASAPDDMQRPQDDPNLEV